MTKKFVKSFVFITSDCIIDWERRIFRAHFSREAHGKPPVELVAEEDEEGKKKKLMGSPLWNDKNTPKKMLKEQSSFSF